jgi:hypothetical protein
MHLCMYVMRVYVCVCVYACMHVYAYVCMCVCMCVFLSLCVYVCGGGGVGTSACMFMRYLGTETQSNCHTGVIRVLGTAAVAADRADRPGRLL